MPKKKSEPKICRACNEPATFGDYCIIHGAVDKAVDSIQEAFNNGDIWKGVLSSAAAIALEKGGPMVLGAAAKMAQAGQPPRQRARPNTTSDPWLFLGLDRSRATEKDVRKMQKDLMTIFHPDKGGKALNPEKVKQINAAVEACMKDLKARK